LSFLEPFGISQKMLVSMLRFNVKPCEPLVN